MGKRRRGGRADGAVHHRPPGAAERARDELLHQSTASTSGEGKARDMKKMARQYLLLTRVCDLAKTMPGRDAREAIRPLFKKMGQSGNLGRPSPSTGKVHRVKTG